jgi:hypothetical protein
MKDYQNMIANMVLRDPWNQADSNMNDIGLARMLPLMNRKITQSKLKKITERNTSIFGRDDLLNNLNRAQDAAEEEEEPRNAMFHIRILIKCFIFYLIFGPYLRGIWLVLFIIGGLIYHM